MKPTSHFLGISLKSKLYEKLFIELQEYFKKNKIDDSIEMQNILSLHITLYYFGPNINRIKTDLTKSLSILRKNKPTVHPEAQSYFSQNGKNTVCYLVPSNIKILEKLNKKINCKYNLDKIVENTYPFTPHITVFRIINHKRFNAHKKNVDHIVNKFLSKNKKGNTFNGFYLYEVNSKFKPEIQTRIEF